MTTAVQNRRGTTAEHATFTGLEGEVTIDTTKDTAVIHDGTLAGGYPLAKETLSNVNPSTLSALTGSATASDDLFLVFDSSTLTMKKITRAELNNAIEADALASVTITGGTINGTTIGATTAAAGSFTTLTASGATIVPAPTLSTHAATKGYVDTALTDLVDSAPAALDTLNELAAALGDDANFSTTVTNSIALKAPLANPTFTGTATIPTADINGGTIDGTAIGASTASTGAFTNLAYTGTLTGGTGVVNLGSGQVYKDADGNVGIGTTPAGKLDVNGLGRFTVNADGVATPLKLINNSATGTVIAKLAFENSGSVKASINAAVYNNDFLTFNTGSDTERMRIDSAGNVGIGTSSPSATIHAYHPTTNVVGTFESGDADVYITLADDTTTSTTAMRIGVTGNEMHFTTSAAERINIASNGDVSFNEDTGTTPKFFWDASAESLGIATSSPRVRLDIRSDAVVAAPTPLANAVASGVVAIGDSVGSVIGLQLNGASYDTYLQARNMGAGSTAYNFLLQPLGGNVGIGTSSPVSKLDVTGAMRISTAAPSFPASGVGLEFSYRNDIDKGVIVSYSRTSSAFKDLVIASNITTFETNSSERMRIDSSGNLLVGTTSDPGLGGSGVQIRNASGTNGRIDLGKTFSGNVTGMSFYHAGTQVGTITYSNTATAYNTSSDYRLKEDWVAVADASTRVNALKPVNFAWKVDGKRVDGFLAHEAAEVVPEAVTGEKDAVDAEGKPQYQGIDQSKLVPLLTAALQEALAKIESLTARVSALEGN